MATHHQRHDAPPVRPAADLVWVVATDRGHDNVELREVGALFQMPKGSTAPWFRLATMEEMKDV